MFKPWQPFDHVLKRQQCSFEISIIERTIKIIRSQWINKECVDAMTIEFTHGIVGLFMFDETTDRSAIYSPENTLAFDHSTIDSDGCEAWFEENSPRKALYGELGELFYEKIDSYYFLGQSINFLIDTNKAPVVKKLKEEEFPRWPNHQSSGTGESVLR